MTKTNYVLGFALTSDRRAVLLIEKQTPQWQKGKLNGIGGKVETFDENEDAAMVREFKEETGIVTLTNEWTKFTQLNGENFNVSVYWMMRENLGNYQVTTHEKPYLITLDLLFRNRFRNCISNLQWLIPMILDEDILRIKSVVKYE